MTRLIRIELLKLGTIRLSFALLATAAALTALFASLESVRAGSAKSGVAALSTASGLSTVTTVTGWAMLLAAVLGVSVASGEFRQGSATLTYLATPRRNLVLAAKAAAAACAGLVFGLVAAIISTGVGLGFAAGHGDGVALSTGTIIGHVIGAMIGAALWAAIGVAVGSLIRSQLAGVIGVFIWGIVIESLLGGLFTSIRPYLPYTAATALAGVKLGNAAFGAAHGISGGNPLPFAAGLALIAGVFLVIFVTAAATTVPRDVT